MSFVHLHCHSQFSLLDGTCDPAVLAAAAAENGMPALALTDTSNLYGAVAFYKACKKKGVKAIIGAELHVQPEGQAFEDPAGVEGGYQLITLVKDQIGYENLCKLVTAAIFDGIHYKPRVDLDLLRQHKDGLIFLTGGHKGVLRKADSAVERFGELSAFLDSDHLYLELSDHGLDDEEGVNQIARQLAADLGYSTVVTNAIHYLNERQSTVLDVQHAISRGALLSTVTEDTQTDQAWFKSEADMAALFPDDGDAMARTVEIADRCDFHFTFGEYHFPATTPPDVVDGEQPDTDANWRYFYEAFPPPRDYGMPDPADSIPPRPDGAGNMKGYFAWYSERGLDLRLERVEDQEIHPVYWDRLRFELGIINDMGFPAYMLIVAEFINWSKDNLIPVGPGRGSAAGSLVAYAMRITDIDPIRYGLLFERFLNPERVSMPDIDVDFCQDRREEAIQHVREKYGEELVSQIITYGKLKAKAAIRDVSRVLGLTFNDADRIAKLIPDQLGITLKQALEQEERLKNLVEGDPRVRRVFNLACAVEGLCRQTGVHAAGVVIADQPLVAYAPLYRDEPEGGPVVQYDMKSAEGIGLIKFDFLGLKTLDQIRDAVAMVLRNHAVNIDMSAIPVDDLATYELLQEGDALGVFQLESSGMRELLTQLRPNCIDDMVALVALYRPGPLNSGMVVDFVERKHGRQLVSYPLPMLEELLKPTYGTIIYQEQVMQIAQLMGGYSLGEADILRRAMGKKDAAQMDEQRVRFVDGSVANNIDREKADEIFDLLAKFAEYGFNKSHSAAYGYIAYQTAYLKAHYRPEFMAALMTIEAANTDKILAYVQDCRRGGIEVLPVCVNRSERAFNAPRPEARVNGDVVHFGMAAVKNVGDGAIEAILDARKAAGGVFESAIDFFERIDYRRVNSRVIDSLIRAGAFDFSDISRGRLIAGLDKAMTMGSRKQEDAVSGQVGLFSMLAPKKQPVAFRWPDGADWTTSFQLEEEHKVLGLYLTGHPMDAHAADVARYATASLADLAKQDLSGREEVRLLGLVGNIRTIRSSRGGKMAFVRLEDAQAAVECTFFSDAWARSQRVLKANEPVIIQGRPEVHRDEVKLRASSAVLLSEMRARMVREVVVRVGLHELTSKRMSALKDLLGANEGATATIVEIETDDYFANMRLKDLRVSPSPSLEELVNSLFGRRVVELL
jgi:DNA polymerase III subunit alpha